MAQDLLRLRDDYKRLEEESSVLKEEAEEQETALRLRMEHMKRQVADAEARVEEVEAQKAKMVPATSMAVRREALLRVWGVRAGSGCRGSGG